MMSSVLRVDVSKCKVYVVSCYNSQCFEVVVPIKQMFIKLCDCQKVFYICRSLPSCYANFKLKLSDILKWLIVLWHPGGDGQWVGNIGKTVIR
jgi:hypothetical protein